MDSGLAGLGDVAHCAALRWLEGIAEISEKDRDRETLAELS